jgi:hypothetical protein
MNNENIVPFGKYKGQPIEAMAQDQQYITWLQGQSWFLERYQNINTLIINNFREPSETPEHNNIQASFTDESFCKKFYKHLVNKKYEFGFPGEIEVYPAFEIKGVDVYINCYPVGGKGRVGISIEIKPCLSDDYPAILRQMMSNGAKYLFTKSYSGTGATIEQVRKIFSTADKVIVLQSDIL